jgi:hypothetical protein
MSAFDGVGLDIGKMMRVCNQYRTTHGRKLLVIRIP